MSTQNSFYDPFFNRGGFRYDTKVEREFLRRFVIPLGGWKKGQTIVEIGAGQCLHSELLRQLGFQVTAIEASSTGVATARKRYPELDIIEADVSTWSPTEPIDHIFCRGMSFYHYELTKNRHGVDVAAQTRRMFGWLKKGGTFVLQIVSDFSGCRPQKAVHQNRLEDYRRLFDPLGQVLGATDWSGRTLPVQSGRADRGIVIATRKR